jgi:hypothetical protein
MLRNVAKSAIFVLRGVPERTVPPLVLKCSRKDFENVPDVKKG